MLPVALTKAVLYQCRATSLVPMQSFDPDQRQIPMGFGWSVIFRPLEDGGDFGLLFSDHAFCNYRLKRPIVAMNTWWEPERDPKPAVGALRYSCFKRACPKSSEQSREVP